MCSLANMSVNAVHVSLKAGELCFQAEQFAVGCKSVELSCCLGEPQGFLCTDQESQQ